MKPTTEDEIFHQRLDEEMENYAEQLMRDAGGLSGLMQHEREALLELAQTQKPMK